MASSQYLLSSIRFWLLCSYFGPDVACQFVSFVQPVFFFIRLKKCASFFGACLHQHKNLFVPNRTYFLFFTLEVSGLILIYNGSNLVFI